MPTIIFRNAKKIENKIIHSANKASFNSFFNAAENYEAYCEHLATKLSVSERIRYIKLKIENLEKLRDSIPDLKSHNESTIVRAIKENLDAIERHIKTELIATNKALDTALKQQAKEAPKPSSQSS